MPSPSDTVDRLEVRLPERERLSVEPSLGEQENVHPVGNIQLLATIDLTDYSISTGISCHPRLGSRVYSAHGDFLRWLVSQPRHQQENEQKVRLAIGTLSNTADSSLSLTPNQLFGRHCAVLGTTGGGKSWSVARLIEESLQHRCKIILLDATGEFWRLGGASVRHLSMGAGSPRPDDSSIICHPHFEMRESDLFAIFRPSGQSQGPKLREAIKSLKLVKLEPTLADRNGNLIKVGRAREPYEQAMKQHVKTIESPFCEFDITALPQQVIEECVWPTDFNDATKYGKYSNENTYCLSLQMRIENIIRSVEFSCIFDPPENCDTVYDSIESFLDSDGERLLRISLENVPFGNNVREILVNAVGRVLLEKGRDGSFKERPTVVILDEAHQFLNRTIGDEHLRFELDAFGLIAKEGRKYSLNVCIATQRPRDIPQDVLSQMGTLIVHRLVNDHDRQVVERAAGDIDRSAAEFLPSLSPGEAIIVGVDIPVPLSIQVREPRNKPDSRGPDYQKYWFTEEEVPVGT